MGLLAVYGSTSGGQRWQSDVEVVVQLLPVSAHCILRNLDSHFCPQNIQVFTSDAWVCKIQGRGTEKATFKQFYFAR